MTFEVPYSGSKPAVAMSPNDGDLETALVQIFTDQPHRNAGNGALVLLRLPVSPGQELAFTMANLLNGLEVQGDVNAPLMLGAWCPDMLDNGNGLAFCTFLPNIIAAPGLLEDQILYQARRAHMARRWLNTSAR